MMMIRDYVESNKDMLIEAIRENSYEEYEEKNIDWIENLLSKNIKLKYVKRSSGHSYYDLLVDDRGEVIPLPIIFPNYDEEDFDISKFTDIDLSISIIQVLEGTSYDNLLVPMKDTYNNSTLNICRYAYKYNQNKSILYLYKILGGKLHETNDHYGNFINNIFYEKYAKIKFDFRNRKYEFEMYNEWLMSSNLRFKLDEIMNDNREFKLY